MSKTFTEQTSVISANVDADGDGMHTLLPYDLVRSLNNLGSYVNPHVHYAQSGSFDPVSNATGKVSVSYTGASSARFMLQIPLLVPLWAARMVWVVGARGMGATTLNSITVHLSKTPYTGPDGNASAFNAAGVTASTNSPRSVSMSSLTGGAYELADDSTTGFAIDSTAYQLIDTNGDSKTKGLAYAIVLATGGVNASVEVDDCVFWFLPS